MELCQVSSRPYHAGNEFNLRWFVRVVFIKLHHESKRPVLKRCIRRANDDGIPKVSKLKDIAGSMAGGRRRRERYHVITFSLTGLALTPAGGSDCILCVS